MKLRCLPYEFHEAFPILEKVKMAGYEAYFVGGAVRDAILGRPIHDVDIAVSSYPEETKSIFPNTVDLGVDHGTILVLEGQKEYEVTTFRTEDTYVDYRRPRQVCFVRSLEEDLRRRDFTVNAFALNEHSEIIDKFHGLKDLRDKILRAVGDAAERFYEDALRIMRGFRLQANLDFNLDSLTFYAMKRCAHLLEKIAVERIFIEFDRLLLASSWKRGLTSFIDSGAHEYLPFMSGKTSNFVEFSSSFSNACRFQTSEQAWTALLLFLKVEDTDQFFRYWKTSNNFQRKVEQMLEIYHIRENRNLGRRDCYHYDLDLILQVENLRQVQGFTTEFDEIKEIYHSLNIHDKREVKINGSFLIRENGFQPGPDLGKLLKDIEFAIVDGYLENEERKILEYIKKRWENHV